MNEFAGEHKKIIIFLEKNCNLKKISISTNVECAGCDHCYSQFIDRIDHHLLLNGNSNLKYKKTVYYNINQINKVKMIEIFINML